MPRSLIDAELSQGLSEMELGQADLTTGAPSTFEWMGRTYPCTTGTRKRGNSIVIGGKIISVDFSIRVRQSAVSTDGAGVFSEAVQPIAGNDVEVNGTNYTIEFVQAGLDGFTALYLIDPNASK